MSRISSEILVAEINERASLYLPPQNEANDEVNFTFRPYLDFKGGLAVKSLPVLKDFGRHFFFWRLTGHNLQLKGHSPLLNINSALTSYDDS